MKKPYQEELDEYEKKRWWKTFRGLLWIVLGMLAIPTFLHFYTGGEVSEATGMVVGLSTTSSQYGNVNYLEVKLDSGKIVQAKIPRTIELRKDSKVIIRVVKTNLFGFKKYRFKEYIEGPKSHYKTKAF